MDKEFMPKIKSIRTRHGFAKIKKYFTEKPKGNIWKRITIYLILLRYFGPMVVIFVSYMMVGMAAPQADVSEAVEVAATAIADVFRFTLTKMFETGQGIAINNPFLSKVIFFLLGNVIWVFYAGVAYLLIDIARHIIAWAYNKKFALHAKVEEVKNE